jgi:hypothetical protein
MTPDLLAEMKERLFTHRIGGRWVAPLSRRMGAGGIVCAEARDLARAQAALRPAPVAPDLPLALLRDLRALEGFAEAPGGPVPVLADLAQRPASLVTSADAPLHMIVALLTRLAPLGVVWKPAPGAAMSAHMLMQHWPGAAVSMVQGDHATGTALAPVLWLSPRPPALADAQWVRAPCAPRRTGAAPGGK